MSSGTIGDTGIEVILEAVDNNANLMVRVFGGTTIAGVIDINTSGTPIIRNQWNHVLIGIKQSTNKKNIICNGSDQSLTVTTFNTAVAAGTGPDTYLFGKSDGSGNLISDFLIGAQWQPWVNAGAGVYIDPVTNLSKFYSAGSPVALGNNGEIVTGSPPKYFLRRAPAVFGTNDGTYGDLAIVGSFGSRTPPT